MARQYIFDHSDVRQKAIQALAQVFEEIEYPDTRASIVTSFIYHLEDGSWGCDSSPSSSV